MLSLPSLPAPPPLSQNEAPEKPVGRQPGLPNHGLIRGYLIFLQTRDPHDVLGQCLFGEHISAPFTASLGLNDMHGFSAGLEFARPGGETA